MEKVSSRVYLNQSKKRFLCNYISPRVHQGKNDHHLTFPNKVRMKVHHNKYLDAKHMVTVPREMDWSGHTWCDNSVTWVFSLGTATCCTTSRGSNISDKLDLKEMAAIHTDYTPTRDCRQNSVAKTHFTKLNFVPLETHSCITTIFCTYYNSTTVVLYGKRCSKAVKFDRLIRLLPEYLLVVNYVVLIILILHNIKESTVEGEK